MEALLAKGADANMADERGETPLHKAAALGLTPTVEALLVKGADLSANKAEACHPSTW